MIKFIFFRINLFFFLKENVEFQFTVKKHKIRTNIFYDKINEKNLCKVNKIKFNKFNPKFLDLVNKVYKMLTL